MSRVLVVDDDPACRAILYLELTHAGHQVSSATTARQGLLVAEAMKPDALVVDMRLTGEWDGVEAARQLRRVVPEAKMVLVTGWEGPLDLHDLEATVVRKSLAGDFVDRVIELLPATAPAEGAL